MNPRLRHVAAAALVLAPAWAEAHSPVPGIGHFYNGAFHPFLVVPHLMALIALGLWTGQRGLAAIGGTVASFGSGLVAGLVVAVTIGAPDTDRAVLAGAAIVGLGVAVARPLPALVAWPLAAALGLAIGMGSGPEGLQGAARWSTLAGTACGALLALVWTAAIASFAVPPWSKLALRITGSWLAASALLVLALAWMGPPGR